MTGGRKPERAGSAGLHDRRARRVAAFTLAALTIPGVAAGVHEKPAGGGLFATAEATAWGAPSETIRLESARGGGNAFRPWMSDNGRYVAFDSSSGRLVPDDTNGVRDVFVYDRVTDTTTRVSVSSDGVQADGESQRPTMSGDGRYVAFWSRAGNLVPGDTNRAVDSFVHDRHTGRTIRVSVSSAGTQGNGESLRPVISRDGRYVAFESAADNLVGSRGLLGGSADRNNARDVFVHELATDDSGGLVDGGTTSLVSVSSTGVQGDDDSVRPSISGDGRVVAFHSRAGNLVEGVRNNKNDVYVHDLSTGATTRISLTWDGAEAGAGSFSPSVSADGRYVSFDSSARLHPDDTNRSRDIYLKDLHTGELSLVSVTSAGVVGNEDSSDSSISGDGRHVAFWSAATNLVAGDNNGKKDVFVRDRHAGTTRRVSVSTGGAESDADSFSPAVSTGGHLVAFDSKATTLAPGSATGQEIFVHVL